MELVDAAGLKSTIAKIACSIADSRSLSLVYLLEKETERKRNHEAIFASVQEKIELATHEKLAEIFSFKELNELLSLYKNPTVQKFINILDLGGELDEALLNLSSRLIKEVLDEVETKFQMLQMLQIDNFGELKN